jgi:hypothetical protein
MIGSFHYYGYKIISSLYQNFFGRALFSLGGGGRGYQSRYRRLIGENVPDTDAPSLCPKGGYFHQASTETQRLNPPPMHQAANVNPRPIYALSYALLFICNMVWGIPYVHNLMRLMHLT